MPNIYDIDLEDGRTITVESDQEPTEDDIFNALSSYQPEQPESPAIPPDAFMVTSPPESYLRSPSGQAETMAGSGLEAISKGLEYAGNVARAIPADLAAGISMFKRPEGQPPTMFPSPKAIGGTIRSNLAAAAQTSGNLPAAVMNRPMPIDATIQEAALEAQQRGEGSGVATTAHLSQGLAATAPLIAGIGAIPAGLRFLASAGFSADMISKAPELFTQYAEEINKPKEEQDPNAVAELQSGIIQTFAFAPLAGAHGAKGIKDRLNLARENAVKAPVEPAVAEVAKAPDTITTLASKKPGEVTVEEMSKLSDAEASALFDAQRKSGNANQNDGVRAGLKLTAEDIPQLEKLRNEAMDKWQEHFKSGDQVSGQGAFGKVTWLNGAIEGAKKSGPNYSAVLSQEGSTIGESIGAKFDGEAMGMWNFTTFDKAGNPSTSFVVKAGSTPEKVTAKYNLIRDNFEGSESQPRPPKTSSPNAQPKAEPSAAAGDQLTPVSVGTTPAAKPVGDWEAWVNKLDELTPLERDRAVKNLADATPKELEQWKAKLLQVQFSRKLEKPSPIEQPANPGERAAAFFPRESEAAGLGEPSMPPTVEDVRRSRAAGSPPPVEPVNTPGTLSDSVRMRKLSERATEAPQIPEPVQETIKGSPESYYRQQSMSKVEGAVRDMSDADLAAVSKDSDIYTAAKLELSTRQLDAGNFEAGTRTFQELSTELTRLGQVINQAKLFQALRPEHVVDVVNKDLSKNGKDPLTPDQAERVRKTAEERIKKQSELNKATDEWTKDPTDANAVKAEKALDESNKAALDEQKLVNQFQSRSTAAILKSILQGNLLTPISQVANVIGNINFSPFRAGVRTIASGIDMIDATLRNRPRKVSVAPLSGTKASVAGLIRGVKQIPGILAKGSGETIKGETRAGLHPLRAWVKQFAKNPDVPTVGGKIPFSERVNLAIEGTFGVPAEIMLRGLGAGDIAFTEMARSRLISEQSRLQKLPPEQARMANNFPELVFDRATLERINQETRGAVFQRHSKLLDHFISAIKGKGDLFDLLVATVAPYKLTPYNIVGEILSYNPLIAMGKTALEAKRGNIRAAEMNAGKVIVGSTLVAAGYWLYDKGLMAPSMDTRDEQQKARVLAGEILPPNHLNISGLDRAMKGGDPAFKPGDETVDVFRAGGLAGSMFYMMANIGRDAETKPETDNQILSMLKNSTLEQARFGLNQSFLKGVAGLLDAVRDGEGDTYLQQYAGTVLSVPLPNTLSTLSRSEREYKVEMKSDTLKKQVENVVRTRLGFAGMDDYLPLKRGLWGEPLRETPKDRNAIVYHFFDITKNKQVSSDPVPVELYRLWRKTANTSVIPSPPDKSITVEGETYLMNPQQRSRYAELVGSERRSIVEELVVNPEWHQLEDEEKIRFLERGYDRGLRLGKIAFFDEFEGQLAKKPQKAGFK